MKLEMKFKRFHSENAFENVVCEMSVILFRSQCVIYNLADLGHTWDRNFTIPVLCLQMYLHPRCWAMGQIRKIDTQNCGLRMRRECREPFPRHQLQRKPLVSDHGTCVTHVPWCMSGSVTRRWRGKRSRHSRRMRNMQFLYLARVPSGSTVVTLSLDTFLPNSLCNITAWWRHQMETLSALLAICAGVNGEFPAQRPVTRSCDVFFDLHLE